MKPLLTLLAAIGFLSIFAVIMNIAYIPSRSADVDEALKEERKALLAEVEAEQSKQATTYSWVDQEKGVVRIPVEQAMDIVAKEFQATRPDTSSDRK